ncbi:MAG TPA: ketoacyl-ACP synthase III [Burkholderiales bacterium]|nr:ketoacyl-ACP synthase III [Burkholderiales bacterium]
MPVKITGIGKCLPGTDIPGRIVTNEDIVRVLLDHGAIKPGTDRPWTPEELTPQKILDLVGIRERRWAADEVNTSDMALVAAEAALREAGIGWEDLGMVAVGTSTPEAIYPSTACLLLNKVSQKKVAAGEWTASEARGKLRIQAFDILAACTSGLYAIDYVRKSLLLPETRFEYGLALGTEVLSRMLDPKDSNADLWGDGSAAVVLKRTDEGKGIICSLVGTDPWGAESAYSIGQGSRKDQINIPTNVLIKGHDIQKFVLKIIPELIVQTLEAADETAGRPGTYGLQDIALFVTHQANARIFEFPARKLGIPLKKFYVNVDRRGNCSSTSVLLALKEAVEDGRVWKGDLVMVISFGGGLTWASMLIEW